MSYINWETIIQIVEISWEGSKSEQMMDKIKKYRYDLGIDNK